jgi:hypothetical protein
MIQYRILYLPPHFFSDFFFRFQYFTEFLSIIVNCNIRYVKKIKVLAAGGLKIQKGTCQGHLLSLRLLSLIHQLVCIVMLGWLSASSSFDLPTKIDILLHPGRSAFTPDEEKLDANKDQTLDCRCYDGYHSSLTASTFVI